MKKLLAILLLVGTGLFGNAANASAPDYVQTSWKGDSLPAGLNPSFQIDFVRFVITPSGYAQISIFPKASVNPSFLQRSKGGFGSFDVQIDIDRNGYGDYLIFTDYSTEYSGTSKVPAKVSWIGAEDSKEECRATSWISPLMDSVVFEFPMNCIEWDSQA